jgi:hypothetical protein
VSTIKEVSGWSTVPAASDAGDALSMEMARLLPVALALLGGDGSGNIALDADLLEYGTCVTALRNLLPVGLLPAFIFIEDRVTPHDAAAVERSPSS